MYLIENEKELKQLKLFLMEYERIKDSFKVDPKKRTILKILVRRLGKLQEEVTKERFKKVMAREELEYFSGMGFSIQWIGFREFVLHQQLTPTLSGVMELEWDFEIIKELACFLGQFYDIIETTSTYRVKVKPFLEVFGEGDFYQLEQDFEALWLEEGLSHPVQ